VVNFDQTSTAQRYPVVAMTEIDAFSLVTVPVQQLANGTPMRSATAFVWKHGEQHYLITNWHVVTGQISKRVLWKRRRVPMLSMPNLTLPSVPSQSDSGTLEFGIMKAIRCG